MADNNSTPYSVAPQNVPYFSDGSILRDLGKLEGSIESMQMSIAEIKDDVKTLKERERVKPSDFQAVKSDVEKLTRWRSYVLGAVAVVFLGITIGATIAAKILIQ